MPAKIILVETLMHQEAFDYYYTLGVQRSYKLVSEKYGYSQTTIANWARSFNWQERIQLRDIEITRKLQQKTDNTIISTKANYRKIIQATISTYVDQLKKKNVTVKSIRDLVDLMRLDMELLGETPQEEIKIIIEDAIYPEAIPEQEGDNADNEG